MCRCILDTSRYVVMVVTWRVCVSQTLKAKGRMGVAQFVAGKARPAAHSSPIDGAL